MASHNTPLPLTPLQQGMLSHWLQHPHSGADIEQMVCTLQESPDAGRLRAAWEQIFSRHECLRIAFDWSGDAPSQMIQTPGLLPWKECTGGESEFAAFLHEDRITGFDAEAAPLMRLTLFRMEHETRLVWTFHHLLLDGRSITRIVHEVFAACDGREIPAGSAGTGRLENWLLWQAQRDHDASLPFWREHLRGVHAPNALVIDGLGELAPAPRQAEADLRLSAAATAGLTNLAARAEVTLNTLVQAAWALLISRYSGEEQVIFGATRACRHTGFDQADALNGLLINTVPVCTVAGGERSLIPWLQSLRQAWTAMRPHELTPLPAIRRAAGLPGDQPLFNHLVVFENEDFTGALRRLEPSWQHRSFDLRELTTVPLTLQAYGGERLRLHCAFDASKFDPVFIHRMLGHTAHLLQQFTEQPGACLNAYSLATPDEARELVSTAHRRYADQASPITLHGWFAQTAARFPDRIAVNGPERSWTYQELDRRSNAAAAALAGAGARRGDIIGILMDRTEALPAAILGILKCGAAYLPVDPAYPAERAAFMLADAAVRAVITDSAMRDKVPAGAFTVISFDDLPASADPPDASSHDPADTAYIIFTSGSTGTPKGCMISHHNVFRLMRSTEPWFGFNETDVWTLFHSAAFDFSVWEIWGALLYGGRLCVVPWLVTRSPDDFCRLLSREQVTVLNQTPSAFRQLIAAEPLARDTDPEMAPLALRTVIFGGEALEMQSLRPWFERHGDSRPRLVNMYGITETTVHVTFRPLSAADLDRGSVIGEPIPDLSLVVLDPRTLQPMPVGIPGEMYVGGAGLAIGYLKRPELTAERFPSNHLTGSGRLYKTGDLARLIPTGSGTDLEFMGRIDDQVKIRGFRIELGEIENVLCSHPRVREACVLVREDRPGDRRLCAWIVAPEEPSAAELRDHLKARLPEYMIPAVFVRVETFPLTTNGKLDRRALPAPVLDGARQEFTAPSTAAEKTLTEIWSRILRIGRVGIHDNFFELGGDSILSIQVIARARESGLHLTPRQLFENPTVAALAALTMTPSATPECAVPAEIAGPFQPSPVQQWFLEQELQGANHWNQTFLFTVSERLEAGALTAALKAIVTHHSALRLRFIRRNNIWEAAVHPEADDDILSLHDLSEHEGGRLARQIERACRVEQARLSFEFGPLLRAAYIDCGEDRPGRLLLTIHHLAVDGVSWRFLLEDVERAYRQALAGKPVALPPATAPFSAWAGRVRLWAESEAAAAERAFWQDTVARSSSACTLMMDGDGYGSNTESDSYTIRTRLTTDETTALVQKLPAAWRTRINDALITALLQAIHQHSGNRTVALHMEGHGREAHIGGDLDVSRTAGWFTTIFPVCLTLPEDAPAAEQVASVRRQLEMIPGQGSGFSALGIKHDAAILFNYLGRMDSVTEGSELFAFAAESTGPWHCQSAERKYQIEINAMIIGGELETAWTAGRCLHQEDVIQSLADGFQSALRDLIRESGTAAPAPDCSLSRLDAAAIARLTKVHPHAVEISALSPMQQLFHSAGLTRPNAGFDQWHCRIQGPLDVEKLEAAWALVIGRHTILRSSFHSAGLPHPVQVVTSDNRPEWTVVDAAGRDSETVVAEILSADAALRNDLSKPLLSRFTLARLSDSSHFLLWSLPDLHLDGWSWPVVFSEVNEAYTALTEHRSPSLPDAPPYRNWLEWLSGRPEESSMTFWRRYLGGISEPTPLPVDLVPGPKAARRLAEISRTMDGAPVSTAARSLGLSPGTLVQAAWALLLARGSGRQEVVFGTAFSGRPAELPDADRIVGPFVNNLPVRLAIQPDMPASTLLRQLQSTLLDLSEHQFTPVNRIQDCSDVPWKSRVFNSLAVFQNYEVSPRARRLGPAVITDFSGPIHTNYALTLVVTPGESWKLQLLVQESVCSRERAAALLEDFTAVLTALAADAGASCAGLMGRCSLPPDCAREAGITPLRRPGGKAPRTRMEISLAALWSKAFGIDDLTTEDNFFDLGGGSLLMVRLHAAIREELGREIPIVDLFRFPTIAALARHMDPAATTATSAVQVVDQTQSRAAAARAAAARLRNPRIR